MTTLQIMTIETTMAGLIFGAVLAVPVTHMLSKIFDRF